MDYTVGTFKAYLSNKIILKFLINTKKIPHRHLKGKKKSKLGVKNSTSILTLKSFTLAK